MGEQRLGLTREMKGFAPVTAAADQAKRALRDTPFACQYGHDRRIGLAALGRCAHGDPQRHATIGLWAQALDCIAPGAGMGDDTNAKSVGSKTERRGIKR